MTTLTSQTLTSQLVAKALFAYAATLNSQYARRACRLAEYVLAQTTFADFSAHGGYPSFGTIRNAVKFAYGIELA